MIALLNVLFKINVSIYVLMYIHPPKTRYFESKLSAKSLGFGLPKIRDGVIL